MFGLSLVILVSMMWFRRGLSQGRAYKAQAGNPSGHHLDSELASKSNAKYSQFNFKMWAL